jgi:hypothetical protein
MIWLFLSGILLSSTPTEEYGACLQILQDINPVSIKINSSNIKCVEHQARADSRYALAIASYHNVKGESDKALKYYERVVEMNDQSEGIIEYFIYLTAGPGCEDLKKCLKYSYLLEKAYNIGDDKSVQASDALVQIYRRLGMKDKASEWRYKSKKKCSIVSVIEEMEIADSVEERFFWRFVFNLQSKEKKDLYTEIKNQPNFDWNKFIGFSSEFVCKLPPYY